jgi:hypothetical protein
MKKIILAACIAFICASLSFSARVFVEGTDYFTEFTQNDETKAAVLRINFISLMPAPAEAEVIIKDQLKIYGKIIDDEKEEAKKEELKQNKEKKKEPAKNKKKDKSKDSVTALKELLEEEEEEERFKNIIASAWYAADGIPENMEKIKFSENSSAFVRLGKTKRTVAFPEYIRFLKKEKEDKKQKEKEKALALKQLQALEQGEIAEEEIPQ